LIRIGTRGSALAVAQASWVADRLPEESRLVEIVTAGDQGSGQGDKSRWVSALERALLDDEIDLAVHSAKDVPAELPVGLELVAIPERADPRDAICGAAALDDLPAGARVGTSSLRRAAQIRAGWPELEIVPMRGNVDTRLRKLADGECDALVLALAGLDRLGRADAADGLLDQLIPAAGQGALAVEARADRPPAGGLGGLTDPVATSCVSAERYVVRSLGASCNTPLGVHARWLDDRSAAAGAAIELSAWLGLPDGSHWIRDEVVGEPDAVAGELAERLRSVGAAELLRAAEAAA
jgi:hydroxymethylbilane synthase